jgi:hypothetical protein
MARGRPALEGQTWDCQVHLRLRVSEDDDLIAFLSKIPARRRVSAIKAALRSGGMSLNPADDGSNAEDELFSALDDFLK